jgi:hypothetical protein
LTGDTLLAQERLSEATALAHERHLDADRVVSALGVAGTYCDQRDALSAWDTLYEVAALLEKRPQLIVPGFFTQIAEVGLLIGDVQSAHEYLLRAETVTNAPPRYEIDRLALRAEISLRTVEKFPPQTLSRLRSLYAQLRLYSGQQFAVGSFCACLTSAGRVKEASVAAQQYAGLYRRERWPVNDPRILTYLVDTSRVC